MGELVEAGAHEHCRSRAAVWGHAGQHPLHDVLGRRGGALLKGAPVPGHQPPGNHPVGSWSSGVMCAATRKTVPYAHLS